MLECHGRLMKLHRGVGTVRAPTRDGPACGRSLRGWVSSLLGDAFGVAGSWDQPRVIKHSSVSWPLRHRGRLASTRSLERRTAGCVLFVTCYLLRFHAKPPRLGECPVKSGQCTSLDAYGV